MKIQRFFKTKKGVVTTTYRQDYRQEGIQLIPGLYGVMVDILSYPQCTKKQIWEAVTQAREEYSITHIETHIWHRIKTSNSDENLTTLIVIYEKDNRYLLTWSLSLIPHLLELL